MLEPTLFDVEVPMGQIPVGGRFIYGGWGEGVVTVNNGRMVRAEVWKGTAKAVVSMMVPGEMVAWF